MANLPRARGKIRLRLMLIIAALVIFLILLMQPLTIWQYRDMIAVLFPKGSIALEQRNMLFIIQGIMLLVIIPVYVFTFIFSWKYNARNPKGKYDPDLIDSYVAECFWWGIPLVLTAIIAVLTWVKTHELDPYKPIESDKKPLHIQVVALQWKWLFIYPEEKIATVNFVQFPKDTPLHFEITADAPMNSFWIPALGGQIYAMPQMRTQLYLIANELGDFRGSSANLSGDGFAGMHFIARASEQADYETWVKGAQQSVNVLDYKTLVLPSKNNAPEIFQMNDTDLFNQIINKYMYPTKE
jgi:cytochrome o ubiquinol oxidase subunit 2